MKKLIISNLTAKVDDKKIIHGISLKIREGEIHSIMGPNGAGKSTFGKVLMGSPSYEPISTDGSIEINGHEVIDEDPNVRANYGLFLSFQNPVEVPGLRVETFLREAFKNRFPDKKMTALDFRKYIQTESEKIGISKDFLKRGLNENFSGGEKKRLEILQMAVLKPDFAILDETDSGLDIDSLKTVAEGISKIVKDNKIGIIIITHYQRILEYLSPDFVHVMNGGKIVKSGGIDLVEKIEKDGYQSLS